MDSILSSIQSFLPPRNAFSIDRSEKEIDTHCGNTNDTFDFSSIGIVIFSKDRPYQLSQLLRSIELSLTDVENLVIIIIYTCSDDEEVPTNKNKLMNAYNYVFTRNKFRLSRVSAIYQNIFQQDLKNSFNILKGRGCDFLMFCVDDLIFIDEFSIR